MDSFVLTRIFRATPDVIFAAWLDSATHTEIVGAESVIDPCVKGNFTIWDGYITGSNEFLELNKKIVQTWRTNEFPDESPDSLLELELEEITNGTKLRLTHSNIPEGQGESYKQGWIDYYFEPMKEYFERKS